MPHQTMIRIEKKTNYVVMNKEALENVNLSWKAKGLLAYLLSLPDDWKIYVEELQSHSKDGRDSTAAALKELIEARYIKRIQLRGSHGKFGIYQYVVYEYPQSIKNAYFPPKTDFPKTVNPNTEKPNTENPKLLNNKLTNKEEEETLNVDLEILSRYEDCILQKASETEIGLLLDLQKTMGKELVIKAITIAILKNGRNLGYIATVLKDWKSKGFDTVKEVDLYLAKWETNNQKAKENRAKQVEKRAENKNYNSINAITNFADYPGQRQYDYDELEKKLLGWDKEESTS